jgi:ATP-dependent DNA helicase DinG
MHKLEYRPLQLATVEAIFDAIAKGKTDIFICAPTGSGKGLLALATAKRAAQEHNMLSYLLTSEKSLQAQYEEDTIKYSDVHGDAASVCGVDTYKCHVNGEKFSLGLCKIMRKTNSEALSMPCAKNCEYLQRWLAAQASPRAIFNYSYYLLQMNYVYEKMSESGANPPFHPRDLVICDEAHKLPDIIEDHFACTVELDYIERLRNTNMMLSAAHYEEIQYRDVEAAIRKVFRLSNSQDKQAHLKALTEYEGSLRELKKQITTLIGGTISRLFDADEADVAKLKKQMNKLPREVKMLFRLGDGVKDRHCKVEDYISIISEAGDDCMVVDGSQDGAMRYHNLNDAHLFQRHFKKFSKVRIYMSATLQPHLLIQRFGCDSEKSVVFNLPSAWDRRRSPIVCLNVANLTYKNQDAGLNACIAEIDRILDEHKGVRGCIHTTSNVIMDRINQCSKNYSRLVPYRGTVEKMSILSDWDNSAPDAVLIGPSLTTGIDLSGAAARFNIIVKISYPSMGSALNAKRYETAYHVYVGEAASTLEQACGRTTRSADDWSITYILDSRAEGFIGSNKTLFSASFMDRIVKKS